MTVVETTTIECHDCGYVFEQSDYCPDCPNCLEVEEEETKANEILQLKDATPSNRTSLLGLMFFNQSIFKEN